MEFTQLPSNSKPTQEFPNLLDNMEKKQFTHSSSSPFKNLSPRTDNRPYFKKYKRNYHNHSIPFYQSSKYQTPNTSNPRPRKPFSYKTPPRFSNLHHQSHVPKKSPPPPKLINPSDSKKLLEFFKNIQPGMRVEVRGMVEKIVLAARIENLVYNLDRAYFTHLIGEFYCNMRVGKGLNGVLHFTTVVDGKLMLVDHKTINRAMGLHSDLTNMPCLDIYKYFLFNKNEFQLLVSNFCDSDILPGLCNTNCGIHFKHFNPIYQQLALIVRANILPKPNQSKYFDFFDLKVIFAIATNRIDFSLGYVVLLNMINANLVHFMPYAMLLTPVLRMYHVSLPHSLAKFSDSQITLAHVRNQVPLSMCQPQEFSPTVIPHILTEEDVYLADIESVKHVIGEQKVEIKRLNSITENLTTRVSYLEGIVAGSMNNGGQLDIEMVNMYQVQLVDEGVMINEIEIMHELEAVGVSGQDNLQDLVGNELGFVAAMENAIG